MKPLKYLFLTSVLCLGVNALTSCNLWYDIESFFDDDTIVDWSPVELYITIEDSIPVTERTIYNYIDSCALSIHNIDLPKDCHVIRLRRLLI